MFSAGLNLLASLSYLTVAVQEAIAGKANADIVETINGTGTVKDVALRDRNAQREMNNSVFKLQHTRSTSPSR